MSLAIFYTGATKFNAQQKDPIKSLGGYISSTEISNNLIGNLFGDLSRYIINLNRNEFRAIAIQNIGLTTLTGLKVWVDYPDDGGSPATETNEAELEIGYSTASVDDCGDLYTQQLNSPFASPYQVSMQSVSGEANALSLPDLTSEGYLILFIKRKLKASTQSIPSADDLVDILEGTVVPITQEDIDITFAWN